MLQLIFFHDIRNSDDDDDALCIIVYTNIVHKGVY